MKTSDDAAAGSSVAFSLRADALRTREVRAEGRGQGLRDAAAEGAGGHARAEDAHGARAPQHRRARGARDFPPRAALIHS